ncbi:TetR/AcrR family transcriptional regulator [Brucella grignonensis]|uniref:Bacterial regulatory, tetR family protein n=1 Tax=Brucella grignonensis TaxID=94627 RepID=A0A256EZ19_9HYPH|nr:TetR/AcrR family transcriptional regulator [Brucella grignonensis]OYR07837.1 bacterial regulatory, tetR family protein [Brucella grignonensis]
MAQEKTKRGRPKVKSDDQRIAEIAQHARDLFISKGFAHVTMDDIAARCHISKRTLYSLFKNKLDIFSMIVDEHRSTMLALPGNYDHLPISDALWAIFRLSLNREQDLERLAVIRLVRLEADHFPELEMTLHERGGEYSRRLLADWLESQKKAARIVLDDPWNAAKILMDMIFGAIIVKHRQELFWPSDEDRRTYLSQCIAIFTKGILPPDSAERIKD